MFEGKYGKAIIIGIVVLVLIALGTLTFFVVDFIKNSNDKSKAAMTAEEYENEVVSGSKKKNKNKTNEEQSTIGLNLQVENIESSGEGGSESSKTKMYKGFPMAGTIKIPKIKLNLPVLSDATKDSIDVSVAINGGPGLNKVGNTLIIGHNYRDGRFFANLKNLANGDKITIIDNEGTSIDYKVYNIYTTAPEDSDFMNRDTNGAREITLDTCTDDVQSRLIVWAKEV